MTHQDLNDGGSLDQEFGSLPMKRFKVRRVGVIGAGMMAVNEAGDVAHQDSKQRAIRRPCMSPTSVLSRQLEGRLQ